MAAHPLDVPGGVGEVREYGLGPCGDVHAHLDRQYEHIKDSAEERGMPEGRATRMAAATVNKERARHGESRTAR